MAQKITIELVESFTKPTTTYLCPLSANIYGIQFCEFKMRDYDSDFVLFQVKKDDNDKTEQLTEESRLIKYHFGPDFFDLKCIGTTVVFKVGKLPVKKFIMIERHYFKEKLIKSYRFQIPFCMPNTKNSLEAIYEIPQFTQQQQQQMINSPWQTKSDSFYFVEGKLIMHNKAQYNYSPIYE